MGNGAPEGAVGAGVADARGILGDCPTTEFLFASFLESCAPAGGVPAAEGAGEEPLGGCWYWIGAGAGVGVGAGTGCAGVVTWGRGDAVVGAAGGIGWVAWIRGGGARSFASFAFWIASKIRYLQWARLVLSGCTYSKRLTLVRLIDPEDS